MALVSSAHMFGINQFTLHIYNFTVATEVLPQMQKLQAMPSKNSNIPSYAFALPKQNGIFGEQKKTKSKYSDHVYIQKMLKQLIFYTDCCKWE